MCQTNNLIRRQCNIAFTLYVRACNNTCMIQNFTFLVNTEEFGLHETCRCSYNEALAHFVWVFIMCRQSQSRTLPQSMSWVAQEICYLSPRSTTRKVVATSTYTLFHVAYVCVVTDDVCVNFTVHSGVDTGGIYPPPPIAINFVFFIATI